MSNMKTILVVSAATMLLLIGATSTHSNSQVFAQGKNTSLSKSPAKGPIIANLSSFPRNQSAPAVINNPQATISSINGSISIRSTIENALASKVKVPLNEASLIAQKAVGSNSTTTLALLRPLSGFLLYDLHVKSNGNNTVYAVIIDPGNGNVLYKRALPFAFSGGVGSFYGGGYRGGCICH
jgi:hypothetical protein